MSPRSLAPDEDERLQALRTLDLLDTLPEERFDRVTRLARSLFHVPIAVVALSDSDRQWFKSASGLNDQQAPRGVSLSLWDYALMSKGLFAISDASADERFSRDPLVESEQGVRFFAGFPLHAPGGEAVGALCIIDYEPHRVSEEMAHNLRDLAAIVEREMGQRTLEHALQDLLEKEAQLRVLTTAVEQSPIAIMITNPNGIIQYVNPRFESDTGFSKAEAVGCNPRILKSGEQPVEFYKELWKTISSGREWKGVFHNRKKDGTLLWESAVIAPVRASDGRVTHYIALKSDITRQKVNEDALRHSEMRLRSIVDSMLGGLLTFAPDGIIETLNPAAEKIFGYRQEDLVGKRLATLFPVGKASFGDRFLHEAHSRTLGEISEWEGRRKDGTEFPFELSLFEIETAHGRRFAGNFRDISERREIERMKSEFVSLVSHELRTPLTSIRGSLGLLKSGVVGALPPKAAELTAIALKNSERLILLINDILDLEKLEAGKMDFQHEIFDIRDVVSQSIVANRGYGDQFGVDYQSSLGREQFLVRADPGRLQQVMANLLSNAAKFSPRGATVDISVLREGESVCVSVHNFGPSIREEFRDRIFQRFAQADSSDQRVKGGTGLGLNICKIIMESMGGTIAFSSELDDGTTFFFHLPLWKDDSSDPKSGSPDNPATDPK